MRIELSSADKRVLSSCNATQKTSVRQFRAFPKDNSLNPRPQSADKGHLCETITFLAEFGFPLRLLKRASHLAIQNGTSGAQELIALNGIGERDFYRLLAKHLDVRYIEAESIRNIFTSIDKTYSDALNGQYVWADIDEGPLRVVIAPTPATIPRLKEIVSRAGKRHRMLITAPSDMRAIVLKQFGATLSEHAVNNLAIKKPDWSVKSGARAWQGALAVIFILLIAASQLVIPGPASLAIHLLMSTVFILCAGVRVVALLNYRQIAITELKSSSDCEKPAYSVMVALNDEKAVVPDLILHLKKLKWPRSKLEIKLVCEANDPETLSALDNEDLDSRFEIIAVPAGEPQTKPKALCFALGLTTGRYITLYDAEDRPHPEQLLEAYETFRDGPENLACLQAPLKIANAPRNFWTSMFHFEYAGLFVGLLPWLARRQSPILLGGTSNHFCGIG